MCEPQSSSVLLAELTIGKTLQRHKRRRFFQPQRGPVFGMAWRPLAPQIKKRLRVEGLAINKDFLRIMRNAVFDVGVLVECFVVAAKVVLLLIQRLKAAQLVTLRHQHRFMVCFFDNDSLRHHGRR